MDAARAVGLSADRIVLFDPAPGSTIPSVQMLVEQGLKEIEHFKERRLTPGEAKTKLALLLFSSGTTGRPKQFQLERALKSIQRYRVTHLCFVPPMAVLLCKSSIVKNYDLGSVRRFMIGAAPVSVELTDQLVRVLPEACKIGEGYGMTEAATMISMARFENKVGKPGSAGALLPGYVARVVKQDGTLAGYNEPGELQLKSPSLSSGYLNNPQATAETFKDGWLCTGDEVIIDEEKEIYIIDRIKELIKVRGFQVAPAELEGLLLDHPDVADACVVGIPDAYSGELPLAFIVPMPETRARMERDADELLRVKVDILEYVKKHKVYYKHLAGVKFVDVIPKNPSGKLLRRILREQAKTMLAHGDLTVASKAKL
ncbi:hypothetical protein BN946_scf184776.g1 [Trametes cinnabarina]|uniref:AMP-dependent synthetase/ligase domain-containing protein n=1 Tax=Pycnoporus cinnabarinus TaxID=5643 RepID=A0A060SMA5_PYCCI|nr:hypothetical protein BN946_scf184776.g1 [Trametes cinnabarina]